MFKALNKETFVCSKNCEFRKFPFHSISDREFITINKKNSKYPCLKCNGECHKNGTSQVWWLLTLAPLKVH